MAWDVRPGAAQGLEPTPASPGAPGVCLPLSLGTPGWGWGSRAAPGTHTGWEHSCGLQARRMALGFVRASQKPRCTILWSSLRRQPYLVNWEPEDESSRGLMGQCGPSRGAWRSGSMGSFSPFLPSLLMGWEGGPWR